jgi:hypothetical protein
MSNELKSDRAIMMVDGAGYDETETVTEPPSSAPT